MKYLTAFAAALLLAYASIESPSLIAQSGALPEVAANIFVQPALSPDGQTLAFVYDGDIWSVPSQGGTARRLTVTEDNDGDPQFSPDGKWLAFRSRRYGNDDVFVMPAEGGVARRLTFADASDQPDCWLPDSSGIIFSSYRREDSRDLWIVRMSGGEPWPITGGGFGVHEYDATITPDGKHIAYCNSGGSPTRRRMYNGTADGDIWVCDFDGISTSNHRRVTDNASHDASPAWRDNSVLLFVSAAGEDGASERTAHIATYDLRTGAVARIGDQRDIDAKDISIGGRNCAITSGNYGGWELYVWNMLTNHPFSVKVPEIKLGSDVRRADWLSNTLTTAEEYAISPDGKKIAFVAGGDVFVMPADEDAVPFQVTDTVQKEVSVTWAPDSSRLVFLKHLSGEVQEVDVGALINGGKNEYVGGSELVSRRSHPTVSADGWIWVVDDEKRIEPYRFIGPDAEKPEETPTAIKGNFHGASLWGGDAFRFSPDGRWVVYDQRNELYDDVIMVADTATGEARPISHLFGNSGSASFSADGKRIVFVNNQEGSYDLYSVELAPEPTEFKEDKLEKLFKKAEKKDPGSDDKTDDTKDGDARPDAKKPAKKKIEVKIDFDGIRDRARRITSLDGHEWSPIALSDGKTYLFTGNSQGQSNLWKLTLDPDKGPDLKQLTQSKSSKGGLSVSADEKTIWFLDGGRISSMSVNGGKITTYNFRVEQRRKRDEVRAAVFDEATWVMGEYFYDNKHHGLDWYATAKRYKRVLASVSTGDEYGALMNDLLGELNSSHQGYYASDPRADNFSESTGCLGLLFDAIELSKGRYKVTEVVKDGPCDQPEGAPKVGEYLIAVNGQMLESVNLSAILVSTIGKKTTLEFRPDINSGDGAHTVAVKPVSRGAEYQLFYDRWVRFQRALVEKLSKGRLGYVHIRAMDGASLAAFKHELGDEMLGKEGVVIDVRYNGGGSTAVDVLEILYKKTWLRRQYGGMKDVSENIYRSIALEKPSILLINQASFSNAEIMAEGFRRLGVGKVVGVDTAGGCIGTGSYSLLDGSRMRLPSTGAFTVDGDNLELSGRKPDIFIENTPEELDKGIDRQTETAVKELLKQIDSK
ncbi:MAG: PD40 domain-containing protein [Planctomycetes bacterium]|nr:PD40 domain-containing protein [Planctomycetota bacterium]